MASGQGGRKTYTLTTITAPKQEILQYMTVDNATYVHWRTLARSLSFQTDSDMASFLLQHYEKTADIPLTQCVKCDGPVIQYCMACNIYMTQPTTASLLQQDTATLAACEDSIMPGDIIQIDMDLDSNTALSQSQQVVMLKEDDITDGTTGGELTTSSNQLEALVEACALQGAIVTEGSKVSVQTHSLLQSQPSVKSLLTPETLMRIKSQSMSSDTGSTKSPSKLESPAVTEVRIIASDSQHSSVSQVTEAAQAQSTGVTSETSMTEEELQLVAEAQALVDAQLNVDGVVVAESDPAAESQMNAEAPVTAESMQTAESPEVADADWTAESPVTGESHLPAESQASQATGTTQIQAENSDKASSDTAVISKNTVDLDEESDYFCEPLFKTEIVYREPTATTSGKTEAEMVVIPSLPQTSPEPPAQTRRSVRQSVKTRRSVRELLDPLCDSSVPASPSPSPVKKAKQDSDNVDKKDGDSPVKKQDSNRSARKKDSNAKKQDIDTKKQNTESLDKKVIIITDQMEDEPSETQKTSQTPVQAMKRKSQAPTVVCKKEPPSALDVDSKISIMMDTGAPADEEHTATVRRKRRRFSCKKAPNTYVCDICEEEMGSRSELKTHINQRHGNRPYACKQCPATYRCRSHLRVHLNRHAEVKPFQCPDCPKNFASNYALNAHRITHSTERPNICDICGLAFKSAKYLKGHKRTHDPTDKPFICQQCGTCFSRKSNLNNHLKIHNNDKQFECPHCQRRFIQSGSLKSHVYRMHNPNRDRPFVCEICGEARYAKDQFEKHMMIHTGTKPFKCDLCGAAFVQSNALKGHMKIHNELEGKSHWCSLCGAAFKKFASLKKHVHKVHQDYPDMSIATYEIIEVPV